jgi:predicted O-linked N-acetylglucosamine transferase (SPINDLY family)
VVSTFLEAFLEGYRRDRLQVELVATKLRYEVSAERLGEQADARHSLQGLSVEESRALLRAQGYDVLVDTAGFTESSGLKVLAQRCAPVQCHWIGYHASTGLATIDWFLGDEVFTPASLAPQFRERLWRLPRAWLARSPRTQSPQVAVSEAEGRPVFGSFNQLAKLGEATFAYWAAALAAVPEAALVIKSWHTVNPSACQRIREDLAQRGVDPSRLTFRPPLPDPDEHLGAYNGIDIALDATPWSSSSTAFDALSMGVPLVAIQGDCASARMSSSLLSAMDRREWICRDPADFAATVAELCRDLPVLRGGKAERQRQVLASPLFDPTDLAWHVGEAFTAMRRLSP